MIEATFKEAFPLQLRHSHALLYRAAGLLLLASAFMTLTAESSSCANNNNKSGSSNTTNNSSSSSGAGASGSAAPAASKAAAPGKSPLQAGQSVKLGDVLVTFNGGRILQPTDFDKPKDGDQYVVTDFTVENTTDKPYNLSTLLSLSMLDKDSRKYDETIVGQKLNGSIEGTIPPKDKVTGEVVFEVPVAGAPYAVRYTQPLGGDSGTWAVTLP